MATDDNLPAADAALVLEYADHMAADGYTLRLQRYGHTTEREASRLVKELAETVGLEQTGSGTNGLQEAYELAGGKGSLTLIRSGNGSGPGSGAGSANGKVQTFLVLEGTHEDSSGLLELQALMEPVLAKASDGGRWSVKVQGDMAGTGEAPQREQAAVDWAGRLMEARMNGAYREGGISNLIFASDRLAVKATKDDDTALQVSIRQDTETGGWKLAVGAPMLTGEF
jgi:hypothetical protein